MMPIPPLSLIHTIGGLEETPLLVVPGPVPGLRVMMARHWVKVVVVLLHLILTSLDNKTMMKRGDWRQ